jgi:hypothetical protein
MPRQIRNLAFILIFAAFCTGGTFTCKSDDDDDDRRGVIVRQNSSEAVRP